MPRRYGCWLLAGIVILAGAARIRGDDKRSPQVDRLFTRWDRKDSPGCCVVVVQAGKVVHQRGYGMANLELGVLNRPSTVFNIASVSKQFTAFLVMLLVSAGLIDLDGDIRTYLPEVPDFGKTITVRQLIHHTSGLREEWDMLTLAGWSPEDSITRRHTLDLLNRQKTLNFDPGAEHSYCNTGYTLLAQLVERVGKKSIRLQAQESIFGPLGMTGAVFQDEPRQLIPGRADSYRRDGKGFENLPYATGRAGPGNLYASALDLVKWDANLYDAKVGAKALPMMFERGKLTGAKAIPYAAGLVHGTYRGLEVIGHNGAIAGYRSTLVRFPKERLTVILLANVSDFDAQGMGRKVADVYLSDKLGPAPPVKEAPKKKQEKTLMLSAADLASFAGDYYGAELDVLYRCAVRDGKLMLEHRRGESVLRPVAPREFRSEIANPVTIRFHGDSERPASGFSVSTERSRNIRFTRVQIKAAP